MIIGLAFVVSVYRQTDRQTDTHTHTHTHTQQEGERERERCFTYSNLCKLVDAMPLVL